MPHDVDRLAERGAGGSRFALATLVAGRGRELIEQHGRRLRRNPLSIALDEVADGDLATEPTGRDAVLAAEAAIRRLVKKGPVAGRRPK